MTDSRFINIALKNNVTIKQIDNKIYFTQGEELYELQEQYLSLANMFMKQKEQRNDQLLKELVKGGMNEVSASFTLAQFIVDYGKLIY